MVKVRLKYLHQNNFEIGLESEPPTHQVIQPVIDL
jgi:hypothetical protein